jgi:four helix bundle protein
MHRYENLSVYQKSLLFTRTVRECTRQFPKEELYNLTSQFRRSADSIALNIAEGAGNISEKEFARFITYSIRSGCECKGCIDIATTNEYINEEKRLTLKNDANELIAMLDGLHKSMR